MTKMNPKSNTDEKKTTSTWNEQKAENTVPQQAPKAETGIDAQALLATVESLKATIDMQNQKVEALEEEALKNKRVTVSDGKKFYEGPRHYSFKKWNGKAVLNYESFLIDNTKGLVYKDYINNEVVNNQGIKLTLWDNAEQKEVIEETDVICFGRDCERSERMECESVSEKYENGETVRYYTFNDPQFGNFTVHGKAIN